MAYNPYTAINAIYNLKNDWDAANKSGDTNKKNKAAENAQVYYNQLRKNGQRALADELSALDASGAKYILDQYSAKNSGVDNQAYNTSMQNATNKNNKLSGYIDSDRNDVQSKYNDIYNYANSDVTKTDEYQSTFKNIMAKYDLSALQGRDNAVASGGASNGGNIDSYAAANGLRQQAALTAQGQQIAHQAGLDAYNARVSNVTNILNNLGVYNDSTYSAMDKTVNNDLNIANSYFTNDETAKNNEVARLSEQASVSGYTPSEWAIKNDDVYNTYLNSDGTFKKEMENVDIQALINSAKASGDTDTANKLAVVRARKILSNYGEFGKYANEGDISYMKPQPTEARRQFDEQNKATLQALGIESELKKTMADNENATNLAIANLKSGTSNLDLSDIEKRLKNTKTPTQELIDAYNSLSGDATTYTVNNPPPITGANVQGADGIDIDGEEEFDIVKKWEDGGNSFQTITVKAFDETMAKEYKVDEYGKKAIKSALSAVANGQIGANGVVSNFDLAEYLINNSNENDTDKKQLKKVFAYFGISTSLLDYVEDVGKGTNLSGSDYKYGVEYIK